MAGIQKHIEVVDASIASTRDENAVGLEMNIALPAGLTQCEVRCANEDKDIYAFYYLYKHLGRCLVFVNSIKCAQRLSNMLALLGLHVHLLHADLAQKQRVSVLEAYNTQPRSVLIATDVAARGLDVKSINHVVHYDIARTPQVVQHSRRAARGIYAVACSATHAPSLLHIEYAFTRCLTCISSLL